MTASPSLRWPTLVFDLDGTLVDTIGLIVASYQHAFRTVLGHEEDEARIRAWIGRPLVRCFQEAAPDHADELFAAYTAWNEANTDAMVRSYAGVADLLGDLAAAGARVAVATSKRRPPAVRALELTRLTDLVPVVVTMEDTAVHKPDPTPLLLAVQRVGATLESVIAVGLDTPGPASATGVLRRGARQGGIHRGRGCRRAGGSRGRDGRDRGPVGRGHRGGRAGRGTPRGRPHSRRPARAASRVRRSSRLRSFRMPSPEPQQSHVSQAGMFRKSTRRGE